MKNKNQSRTLMERTNIVDKQDPIDIGRMLSTCKKETKNI